MNNEIKINKANKSITFINNGIAFSQFGIADEILDLITNLQQDTEMYAQLKDEYEEEIKDLQQENEELKKKLDRRYYKNEYERIKKENERLKENNSNMQEEMARVWKENERLNLELSGYREAILRDDKLLGLQDYKSRCEKAIEYIDKQKKKMYKSRNKIALFILMKLENILQNGSDSQ